MYFFQKQIVLTLLLTYIYIKKINDHHNNNNNNKESFERVCLRSFLKLKRLCAILSSSSRPFQGQGPLQQSREGYYGRLLEEGGCGHLNDFTELMNSFEKCCEGSMINA